MAKAQKYKVALAIQNPDLMTRIEINLDEVGFETFSFKSAEQAMSCFNVRRPRIIITERRFKSRFAGLDLCRQIRKYYLLPYIYIIILSNMSRYSEIDDAISVGADDYLVKPFNPFQIRSRIRVAVKWLSYIDSITLPQA